MSDIVLLLALVVIGMLGWFCGVISGYDQCYRDYDIINLKRDPDKKIIKK